MFVVRSFSTTPRSGGGGVVLQAVDGLGGWIASRAELGRGGENCGG